MKAGNVNDLLNDPLAGFIVASMDDGPYNTFLMSVQTRMRIFMTADKVEMISDQIMEEFKPIIKKYREYFITELLYEYRISQGRLNDVNEYHALKKLISKVISIYGQDAGLDFYRMVTTNRGKRDR